MVLFSGTAGNVPLISQVFFEVTDRTAVFLFGFGIVEKHQKCQEDATPHFLPGVYQGDSDSQFSVPKRNTTVRKTFLELQEQEDEFNEKPSKQLKRSISTGEIMACFV